MLHSALRYSVSGDRNVIDHRSSTSVASKMLEEGELQKQREQDQIRLDYINSEKGFVGDELDSKPLSLQEYNEQKQQRASETSLSSKKLKKFEYDSGDEQVDSSRKKYSDAPMQQAQNGGKKSKATSNLMRFRRVTARSNAANNIEYLQQMSKTLESDNQAQEEIRKLMFHEENMDIMNPILEHSAVIEEKLVSKVGEKAFSSVAKHDRGVKRDEERLTIEKMLNKIHQRTQATKNIEEKKRKKSKAQTNANSIRRTWIDESKSHALKNLNEQEQKKRIEDIVIKEREKQERAAEEYKHNVDKINDDKRIIEMKNQNLMTTIAKLEDEITSLKYTISLLRQKLTKVTSREVESQQKLKLFADYEPLFEDLRKKFNFDNPQQVIKRMELLEKAQADSYNQLLEAQEQRNQMERTLEKTKQEAEAKNRERMLNLTKNLEKAERQSKELQKTVEVLEKAKERADGYSQKYMDLNRAIADIWYTWLNDVERIGRRDDVVDDPDTSDSHQTISAIKNILINFTPSKAGRTYTEFSILANNYWKRYFQDDLSLKSKPMHIFEKLGDVIDAKSKEIRTMKLKIIEHENFRRDLEVGLDKAHRERRVAEQALATHRVFQKSRYDGYSSVIGHSNAKSATTTPAARPKSAPMHGRRKRNQHPLMNSSRIANYSNTDRPQYHTTPKSPSPKKPSIAKDSVFITQQDFSL